MWLYTSIVSATRLWPRRSLTIFGWTLLLSYLSRFSASRLTGLSSQKMRLSTGAQKNLLGIERQIALLCWLVRNAKNGRHCVTFVICDGLAIKDDAQKE
jgi:hypothetical protein